MSKIWILLGLSLVSFATAGFVAEKIWKNKIVSIVAGLLYTLVPYRFHSILISEDMKEAVAWALLPLVIYVAYWFLGSKDGWLRKGMIGVGCFGVALAFLNLPLWIRDGRLFLRGEFSADGYSMQNKGVYLVQYLMTYFQMGTNTDYGSNGMVDSAAVGIGFGLTMGVLLYVWLLCMRRTEGKALERWKREIGFTNMMFLMGVIVAFLSSNVFPWDDLRFSSKLHALAVILIQNPARLMGIVAVCFWIVSCMAVVLCVEWKKERDSER